MYIVEVYLPVGREAEQFNRAFYRFLELNLPNIDDDKPVAIESFPDGVVERKRVTLWSAGAARKFRRFWRSFASDQSRPSSTGQLAAEASA